MRTIFKALSAVQSELAAKGIAKGDTNTFDNYKFRGIDAVLNALAPILAKSGVVLVPSVDESEIRTIASGSGKAMNHCKVKMSFTFYDSEGDSICHTFHGEAMDRGDKSLNKAATAAYKYFLFQAFTIPVEGTPDADSESHEIQSKTLDDWILELQPTIDTIQAGIAEGEISVAAEAWYELSEEEKRGLWVAPTKGGPFTTAERKVMQSTEFRESHFGEKAA